MPKYRRQFLLNGFRSDNPVDDTSYVVMSTFTDDAEPVRADGCLYEYEADYHSGATIYFEANLLVAGGNTVYASLFDSGASQLVASEITTTSSTQTRVRSSSLTLSDGEFYHVRGKVSSSAEAQIGAPRLIIDTDSSSDVDLESYIDLHYGWWFRNSATYSDWIDTSNGDADIFYYESKNWDSDTTFHNEAHLGASSGTAYCELYNRTGASAVSSSELSTTSTSLVKLRSASLSLTNENEYISRFKSSGPSDKCYIAGSKVVAILSAPVKFELHFTMTSNDFLNSNHTSYVGYTHSITDYDISKFNDWPTMGVYFEAVVEAATSQTIYRRIYDWDAAAEITGSEISTTSTTPVRIRSGDIKANLPSSSSDLKSEWKVSGGSTGNNILSGGKLIFVMHDDKLVKDYSREANASLPSNDDALDTAYTDDEVDDVNEDDATRVEQSGEDDDYMIHEFKKTFSVNTKTIYARWNGQTTVAPSTSTVFLQIYNRDTQGWETLDSDNSSSADTDFTLEGVQSSNLSDYYDADYIVSFRVYQREPV